MKSDINEIMRKMAEDLDELKEPFSEEEKKELQENKQTAALIARVIKSLAEASEEEFIDCATFAFCMDKERMVELLSSLHKINGYITPKRSGE